VKLRDLERHLQAPPPGTQEHERSARAASTRNGAAPTVKEPPPFHGTPRSVHGSCANLPATRNPTPVARAYSVVRQNSAAAPPTYGAARGRHAGQTDWRHSAPVCHRFGQLHSEPVGRARSRATAFSRCSPPSSRRQGWTDPGPSPVTWIDGRSSRSEADEYATLGQLRPRFCPAGVVYTSRPNGRVDCVAPRRPRGYQVPRKDPTGHSLRALRCRRGRPGEPAPRLQARA
jgi:hypothetical protein